MAGVRVRGGGLGGLRLDVGSECLLFGIIVVITASASISGVHVPASLIITIRLATVLWLSIYHTGPSQEFPLLSCC